jgi:hypothetical protein
VVDVRFGFERVVQALDNVVEVFAFAFVDDLRGERARGHGFEELQIWSA